MATNERPGVYSSYEVTNSISGTSAGGVVGVVGIAESGFDSGVVAISTEAAAIDAFGATGLAELCALALRNGASIVHAIALEDGADADDYAEAFASLAVVEDIGTQFCDSRDSDVHKAMEEAIASASEAYKYRIGVVEYVGTVTELVAAAKSLNYERMVLVAGNDDVTEGYFAAALVGAIAATTDPAVPINGAELLGIEVTDRYSDTDINTLVRGGVSLLEQSGTGVYALRVVSTCSEVGGVSDATWREITVVRIIDEVIPAIRTSLRSKFSRAKNTEQTRGAIRTQVVIDLEQRVTNEIINSYGDVTVSVDDDEPTMCAVEFEFAVTHGLSHIMLTAKITV